MGFLATSLLACAAEPSLGAEAGTEPVDGSSGAMSETESGADVPSSDPSAAALYAQGRCAAAMRCGCTVESFASVDECAASMEARFMVWQDQMEPAIFSAECFEAVLGFFAELDCATLQSLRIDDLGVTCDLYWGERSAGEACVGGGGTTAHGHNCDEGLVCASTLDGRVCTTPADVPGLAAENEICAVDGTVRLGCAAGLFCDPQSQVCRERVEEGAACPDPVSCAAGLWCDNLADPNAPICAPRRAAGADCISASSCAPQGCELGVCATAICAEGRCDATTPRACFLADL